MSIFLFFGLCTKRVPSDTEYYANMEQAYGRWSMECFIGNTLLFSILWPLTPPKRPSLSASKLRFHSSAWTCKPYVGPYLHQIHKSSTQSNNKAHNLFAFAHIHTHICSCMHARANTNLNAYRLINACNVYYFQFIFSQLIWFDLLFSGFSSLHNRIW